MQVAEGSNVVVDTNGVQSATTIAAIDSASTATLVNNTTGGAPPLGR